MVTAWWKRALQRTSFGNRTEPSVEPEPPVDSEPSVEPAENIDFLPCELPCRWGDYLLLKRLTRGHKPSSEVFVGKRSDTPWNASESSSLEAISKDLVVIRRQTMPVESDPLVSDFISLWLSEDNLFKELDHPQICRLMEAGAFENEALVAREYAAGESIGNLLRRLRPLGLEWEAVTFIAHEMCAVLEYAHSKTDAEGNNWALVLSQDGLSRSDMFIDYSGGIRIADIELRSLKAMLPKPTGFGPKILSVSFFSPEGIRGKAVDARSDIFCIGSLMWELASGKMPFSGDTEFEMLNKLAEGDVETPTGLCPDIPKTLANTIMKAMSKAPSERHQSATDLKRELGALIDLDRGRQQLAESMHTLFLEEREQLLAEMRSWIAGASLP